MTRKKDIQVLIAEVEALRSDIWYMNQIVQTLLMETSRPHQTSQATPLYWWQTQPTSTSET